MSTREENNFRFEKRMTRIGEEKLKKRKKTLNLFVKLELKIIDEKSCVE